MLIGDQPTGRIADVVIGASANGGLRVTVNGQLARLAVVMADGSIAADGAAVATEAFNVSVNAYRDLLRGRGHLHTLRTLK